MSDTDKRKHRIFLTGSPINLVFYLVYIRNTEGQFNDILIFDKAGIPTHSKTILERLASLHSWYEIIDLSTVGGSRKVSNLKKITRRIRTLPVFRPIYNRLLKRFREQQQHEVRQELMQKLNTDMEMESLNILTETAINDLLKTLYPSAEVRYFEHGLSDYHFIETALSNEQFFCVFDREFHRYNSAINCHAYFDSSLFRRIISAYFEKYPVTLPGLGKKNVLVLLQNLEFFQVPTSVQIAMLQSVLSDLRAAGQVDFTLVLKPHPLQYQKVLRELEAFLIKENVSFVMWEQSSEIPGIELFFEEVQDRFHSVYSIYSSGLFYLSKLYAESNTEFCYVPQPLRKRLSSIRGEFGKIVSGTLEQADHIFSANCRKLN